MARPYIDPKKHRNRYVMVRFRADEMDELTDYCAEEGILPSVAVRELALKSVRQENGRRTRSKGKNTTPGASP